MRHPLPCRYSDEIGDSNPNHDFCTCPRTEKKNYEPDPKPIKTPKKGKGK